MKISVEYLVPRVSVREVLEVGDIVNGKLNNKQSKMVDKLINNKLKAQLSIKVNKSNPSVRIKSIL